MRKQVFFTGTVIALMFLLSSSTTFAQGLKISNDEAQSIQTEIREGKPIKEVLEKHRITMGQIRSALTRAGGFESGKRKLSNTQIATIATKLGLDPAVIQSEIQSGKTLHQILNDHNISKDQLKELFNEESQTSHRKKFR